VGRVGALHALGGLVDQGGIRGTPHGKAIALELEVPRPTSAPSRSGGGPAGQWGRADVVAPRIPVVDPRRSP
jgi:hypothetical protein